MKALAVVLLLLGVTGCKREPAPPAQTPAPAVRFVELFPNGADKTSPLVVVIHGRGGSPEEFVEFLAGFPGKAHVAMPQAPIPFGDGWSWFDMPPGSSDDDAAARIGAQEEKLWPAISALAKGRKVIVTGFSQGGMLSFVLAARHPEIALALPISGGAPGKLLPTAGARTAPVFAMHGADDSLIKVDFARSTVAGFKKAGATAELREYPGVGHTITAEMRAELFARIAAALEKN